MFPKTGRGCFPTTFMGATKDARAVAGPWRFASLIPSGWRLTPIHKVMGDHASRGSTPGGAFLSRGSLCVIYFVARKRFRQYRGCMLGHFVPKKRFSLHQMCVLHCSLYIITYVSPRPRPVCTKTFFTHVVVKMM